MTKYEVTLTFDDVNTCAEFNRNLAALPLEQDHFYIALPPPGFHFDNAVLSMLVTFVEHGGLEAVAGVAELLKIALEKFGPERKPTKVHIESETGEWTIDGNLSVDEIRDVLDEKIFRK